jgi:alanine dehydrogenase
VGAVALQKEMAQGGQGVLLGGVPGVAPANVVVIGGGVVGDARGAHGHGLGAEVLVLDRALPRLRQLDEVFAGRLQTGVRHWRVSRRRCATPIWSSAPCWCRAPRRPS